MYVHFLLGLGGWVGAPEEEDGVEAAAGPARSADADPRPPRDARAGCPSGRPAHRCCRWRAHGLPA